MGGCFSTKLEKLIDEEIEDIVVDKLKTFAIEEVGELKVLVVEEIKKIKV